MSTKKMLRKHMEEGFGLCKGTAIHLSSQQSGGRRLNEIIQDDSAKYVFFMAQPQRGGAPYKVFFRNLKRLIKIEKDSELGTFKLVGNLGYWNKVRSREYISRKSALNAIKSCN